MITILQRKRKSDIYVQSESHNSAIDWAISMDRCNAWQHIPEEKNEQQMKKPKVIDIFYIFFARNLAAVLKHV